MTNQTTLSDVLRGTYPGTMQSVGIMQVIPLLSDTNNIDYMAPTKLNVSTSDYGTLEFRNPYDKPAIIPQGAAYITEQKAQDHALCGMAIVGKHNALTVQSAACIQSEQGGLIRNEQHKIVLLPFLLRESALRVRHERSYNKLWTHISGFNRAMGLRNIGHVDVFLHEFQKSLDRFVAEFEPVQFQVGAIILIDGKVVGIERTPSWEYWAEMWRTVVRECYGSLALYMERNRDRHQAPSIRQGLNGDFGSLDDLIDRLKETEEAEAEATKNVARALMNEPITMKIDVNGTCDLESRLFVGQMLLGDAGPVYASIIATEAQLVMKTQANAFVI